MSASNRSSRPTVPSRRSAIKRTSGVKSAAAEGATFTPSSSQEPAPAGLAGEPCRRPSAWLPLACRHAAWPAQTFQNRGAMFWPQSEPPKLSARSLAARPRAPARASINEQIPTATSRHPLASCLSVRPSKNRIRVLLGPCLARGNVAAMQTSCYRKPDRPGEDRSQDVLQDDVFARLLTFPSVLLTAHQGLYPESPSQTSPTPRSPTSWTAGRPCFTRLAMEAISRAAGGVLSKPALRLANELAPSRWLPGRPTVPVVERWPSDWSRRF